MSEISELAKELVDSYRDATPYQRQQILAKQMKPLSFKRKRRLARYFCKKANLEIDDGDHQDESYYYKLMAWGVLERAGILMPEQMAAIIHHREELLAKGPRSDAVQSSIFVQRSAPEEGDDDMDVQVESSKKKSAAKADLKEKKAAASKELGAEEEAKSEKKESKKEAKSEKKESKKEAKVKIEPTSKLVRKKGAARKSDGGESFGDKVWDAFAKPNTPKSATEAIALEKAKDDKKKAAALYSKILQKVIAKVMYHMRGGRIVEA